MSSSPFTQLPPASPSVFVFNPSARLLAALGKTENDLLYQDTTKSDIYKPVSEESGFYLLEIPSDEWPANVKVHHEQATSDHHQREFLYEEYRKSLGEEPSIKKIKKPSPKKIEITSPSIPTSQPTSAVV